MSSTTTNPRRTPPASRDIDCSGNGLSLKTSSLRKGATFHSPTSPSCGISSLRRSQTTLEDVVGAHRRRALCAINDLNQTLAGISLNSPPKTEDLPMPRAILDATIMSPTKKEEARRVLRPRSVREPSDSGYGSVSVPTKRAIPAPKKEKLPAPSAAITFSTEATTEVAGLSQKGLHRIREHILQPLADKIKSCPPLSSVVRSIPQKIYKKEIVCLRDVEKTLLHSASDKVKSPNLYLDFCLTSLALIQTTVDQLGEREQTRAADRPYTNGYFLDLCDQVKHYAGQLATSEKTIKTEPGSAPAFSMSDEIKLYGGIAINGREAELIRITSDGKAYSLRDGREVLDYSETIGKDGVPMFKRSRSEEAEAEEEIMRSMARRKKNPTPEELAPKVCKHPGCDKQFARPCDLTKHEKTHSRPWKCPDASCRYHEMGWPTEKEMDRHYNDKHSANPHFFKCKYAPCPYKSKRESNCKQHMEKTHGWKYDRTKNNGKKGAAGSNKPTPSTHPTPIVPSLPTPTSDSPFTPSCSTFTNFNTLPSTSPVVQADPILFPTLATDEDFSGQWRNMDTGLGLDMGLNDMDLDLDLSPVADNGTPISNFSADSLLNLGSDVNGGENDLYAAPLNMPLTPCDNILKDFNLQAAGTIPSMMNFGPLDPNAQMQMQMPQQHMSPAMGAPPMMFTPASMKEVNHEFSDDNMTHDEDFPLFGPSPKLGPGVFGMPNNNYFPDLPATTAASTVATSEAAFTSTTMPAMDFNTNFNEWTQF